MGKIIAGFPCIGKSTLGRRSDLNIIDLESTKYKYILDPNIKNLEEVKLNLNCSRNPEWPQNYIKAIQEAKEKYDIVFVLGKYDFNMKMVEENIDFLIAYPDPEESQKEDYLERARSRNNSQKFLDIFSKNFEKWQSLMASLPVDKIILKKGEYIGDAIERLGIYGFGNDKESDEESKDKCFDEK